MTSTRSSVAVRVPNCGAHAGPPDCHQAGVSARAAPLGADETERGADDFRTLASAGRSDSAARSPGKRERRPQRSEGSLPDACFAQSSTVRTSSACATTLRLRRPIVGPAIGEQEVSAEHGRATCIHALAILTSDVVDAAETILCADGSRLHGRGTYWLRKARAPGVSTRCSQGPLSHSKPSRLISTAVM